MGDNVFIKSMPAGLDEDSIKAILGQYGTLVSIKIVSTPDQAWTSCLARFASAEEASGVVSQLNGNIPNGLSTPVDVSFAKSRGGPGGTGGWNDKGGGKGGGKGGWNAGGGGDRFTPYGGAGAKGKGKVGPDMEDILRSIEDSGALPGGDGKAKNAYIEMFIFGLLPNCTDLHLYRMMAPFGQIAPKGVKTMLDKADGSCLGYGFVNFLAQESADLAIATLNGAQLPNGKALRIEQKKAKN